MPCTILRTFINVSPEIVFDLSISVDLHKLSAAKTGEEATSGKTSGLMKLNDTVGWRAKHIGIWQTLSTKITAYQRPYYFIDEMQKVDFKRFTHHHYFTVSENGCQMKDMFSYKSPLGMLGKLAEVLFLERYMTDFLKERNKVIKEAAESGKWKEILA